MLMEVDLPLRASPLCLAALGSRFLCFVEPHYRLGGGFPFCRKKYPYFNLSTGGPSWALGPVAFSWGEALNPVQPINSIDPAGT